MTTYHEFSQESVDQALAAAERHNELIGLKSAAGAASFAGGGGYSVLAQCVSVTVEGNKVCLNLPLGIGKVCIPIPISFPNGTAAQACLSICTTWGIPTGVKVTVSILGQVVVQKSFGKC